MIKVPTQCLKEVNRLRETFRKNLPLYTIPCVSDKIKCKKLTGSVQLDRPKMKNWSSRPAKPLLNNKATDQYKPQTRGCPEKESLQMCVRVRNQQRSLPQPQILNKYMYTHPQKWYQLKDHFPLTKRRMLQRSLP